jgi:hypothetical protein
MAECGTRSRYKRGCRCERCTAANTRYFQESRARRRGFSAPAEVGVSALLRTVQPDAGAPPEIGRNEAATLRELGGLSGAVKRPGLAESALSMARILDNPKLATTHPSAQGKLSVALAQLWAASVGRSGNLASVASMSQRGSSGRETG